MNQGQLRGIGMHNLFPNVAGQNWQYPAGNPVGTATSVATTPTIFPGSTPVDGSAIRKLASAEGGVFFSQDYIFIGNTVNHITFPKGVWSILIQGGGAAGGPCAAGSNGTRSGGGGSASAFSFQGRFTFDGVQQCAIIIGAGGVGATGTAPGNSGGTTQFFLPNGVEWFILGGSGGLACSSTITGFGGVPGYPAAIGAGLSVAPFAFVYPGSGGGLNTGGIFVSGQAGPSMELGPTGGGAGAATNASLGGKGGQAGLINGGGSVGTGNTGTTTAGAGGNAGANTGCGGGGSGGSFTGGTAQVGGNGGSGWVEAFRVG